MVKEHPFGVGIGNQVMVAVADGSYRRSGTLAPSLWQPVHNMYVLVAVETGVLGLAAFVALLGYLLWSSVRAVGRSSTLAFSVVAPLTLSAFLAFALFDHFFWTIEQGRLLFWLAVGIVMATNRARSSTDRTHPSEG